MPSSIAPIEVTRSHSVRPPQGLRYGNFEGVIHLPPVQVLGRRNSDFSSLNNQQIYKTVCEWFEAWRPWQQRISLSGIANRCSAHQLDILATTLEPIRHRDYTTASHQRYPSAPFRKVREIHRIKIDSPSKHKPPKQKKPKPSASQKSTEKVPTPPTTQCKQKRKKSRSISKQSSVSFADDNKLEGAVDNQKQSDHEIEIDSFADQLATSILQLAVSEAATVVDIEKRDFTRSTPGEKKDGYVEESVDIDDDPVDTPREDREGANGNESEDLEEKDVESIDSDVEQNEVSHEEKEIDTNNEQNKDPGNVIAMEPPVSRESILKKYAQKKKKAGKYKVKTIVLRTGSQRSSRSGARTSSSHFRSSVFGSSAVSTLEYFSPRQALGGKLMREIRTGPVQKPSGLEDIPVPIARSYKSVRWWPEAPNSNKTLKTAKRSELSGSYREQLAQIWEWLSLWEDFERIALLREVVKVCDATILEYLVSHINQKIRDDTDINRLMDRTLLYIFSYLKPHEIDVASQVSRRWRFLCASDELWMLKCLEMGEQEGVEDITGLVLAANSPGRGVDWKLAYLELKHLIHTMKQGLAVPQDIELGTEVTKSDIRDGPLKNKKRTPPKVKIASEEPKRVKKRVITYCRPSTDMESEDSENNEATDEEDLSQFMSEYALQTEVTPPGRYMYQRQYRRMSRLSKKVKEADKDASMEEDEDKKLEEDEKNGSVIKRTPGQNLEEEEEEPILDIRPTLSISVDLLGKVVPGASLQWQKTSDESDTANIKQRKFAGTVTPVQKVRKLQGHMSGILCLEYDKKRLVTGGQDRSIRVWDVRSGRSLHKFYGPKGGVRSLQFDNEILVSGSWDMLVMVWDMKLFTHIASLSGHKGCVSSVKLNKDYIVSGSHDGTVRVWERQSYYCSNVLSLHRASINSICLDKNLVITAASDMQVKMTDITTGHTVLKFESVHANIHSVVLQDCLLIGSDHSGTVFFWNKINGESEAAVKTHDAPVHKVTYHQGRLWTASGDNTVKEWDLSTMTCIRALQGHKGPVRDIKVSDERIVTCSDDGTIRIWDFILPKSKQDKTLKSPEAS